MQQNEAKNLSFYEKLVLEKLKAVKDKAQVFAMDYDGTLADGNAYKKREVMDLVAEILDKGKIPAFITARAATALKTFVPSLKEYYKKYKSLIPTYIAGGNGTVLYRLDAKGIKQVYSRGLTVLEVKDIVEKWEKYEGSNLPFSELNEKGLKIFNEFYQDTWEGLVPAAVLNLGRKYQGRIFTEGAKVTFVLPKDTSRHKKVVEDMQNLVGNGFSVLAGDENFCHITKRLEEDSKLLAVKKILELENLKQDQAVTFGDMPNGNDKGLLSLPYSFTNSPPMLGGRNLEQPPYVLPKSDKGPVGSVHTAVKYLLT